MKPLVSVVLGSYNRKFFLKRVIRSIRGSQADFAYEIIVVDGGSTDGSTKWLLKQKDIISIVQHNRGVWKGKPVERRSWGYFMNLGFKCAQGKYVLMLSDDCLLHPDAMMNGAAFFEERLARGMKLGAVPFYWRNWPRNKKYFVIAIKNQVYLNHGMYLKAALAEVNYINEDDYVFYCADLDLSLRLLAAGYRIEPTERAIVEHYNDANLRVRQSNKDTHERDRIKFEATWADFLEGRQPIDLSSTVEAAVIPNDDLAKRGFGLLHYWYRAKAVLVFALFNLYFALRKGTVSDN
jgi:glycosyltransferase involved in cell wall biosynthesis